MSSTTVVVKEWKANERFINVNNNLAGMVLYKTGATTSLPTSDAIYKVSYDMDGKETYAKPTEMIEVKPAKSTPPLKKGMAIVDPVVATAPVVATTPVVSTAPVVVTAPVVATAPVVVTAPVVSPAPVVSTAPVVTKPVASTKPVLTRMDTITGAHIHGEARPFNDILNKNKKGWDQAVFGLLTDFSNKIVAKSAELPNNGSFVDMVDATIVRSDNSGKLTFNEDKRPKVWLLGGGAYNSYSSFLKKDESVQIDKYAPRTHDYDINICINTELSNSNESEFVKTLGAYLTNKLNEMYTILNKDNYIETNFENVSNITDQKIRRTDEIIFTHPSGKMELTVYGRNKYKNFRINMAIKLPDGRYFYDHIVELIFHQNRDTECPNMRHINVLETNEYNYFLSFISFLSIRIKCN